MSSHKFIVKALCEDAIWPQRATEGSAGYDVFNHKPQVYEPGINKHSIGLSMRPPKNHVIKLVERSSAAAIGLTIAGGVIDEDFDLDQDIILIVYNRFDLSISAERGKSICQAIISHKPTPETLFIGFKDTRKNNLVVEKTEHRGIGSTGNAIEVPELQHLEFTTPRKHPKPYSKKSKCPHCRKSSK